MDKVLVIDDGALDRKICADVLQHEGFEVLEAADGPSGLRMLYSSRPQVVLLDVLMPVMDGWRVCERIREVSDVPIIMLTSLNGEEEMARGLEIGADDFVSKPISPRHLAARVRAVLRRAPETTSARALIYDDGELAINVATHQVTLAGRRVALTPTEFRLLVALAESPAQVHGYRDLLHAVWGPEYVDDVDFLRVYVWRLRKKLESAREGSRWILTERGFGYRFRPPWAPAQPAMEASQPLPPGEQQRCILLVEDDALSLKLMRDALQARGYHTQELTTGTGVVEVASQLRPDLIVMDIGLPGMNGEEATRALRRDAGTRSTPILAVSAYAMPSDEERMRLAGCDRFLAKPLRFADFVSAVAALLPARDPGGPRRGA